MARPRNSKSQPAMVETRETVVEQNMSPAAKLVIGLALVTVIVSVVLVFVGGADLLVLMPWLVKSAVGAIALVACVLMVFAFLASSQKETEKHARAAAEARAAQAEGWKKRAETAETAARRAADVAKGELDAKTAEIARLKKQVERSGAQAPPEKKERPARRAPVPAAVPKEDGRVQQLQATVQRKTDEARDLRRGNRELEQTNAGLRRTGEALRNALEALVAVALQEAAVVPSEVLHALPDGLRERVAPAGTTTYNALVRASLVSGLEADLRKVEQVCREALSTAARACYKILRMRVPEHLPRDIADLRDMVGNLHKKCDEQAWQLRRERADLQGRVTELEGAVGRLEEEIALRQQELSQIRGEHQVNAESLAGQLQDARTRLLRWKGCVGDIVTALSGVGAEMPPELAELLGKPELGETDIQRIRALLSAVLATHRRALAETAQELQNAQSELASTRVDADAFKLASKRAAGGQSFARTVIPLLDQFRQAGLTDERPPVDAKVLGAETFNPAELTRAVVAFIGKAADGAYKLGDSAYKLGAADSAQGQQEVLVKLLAGFQDLANELLILSASLGDAESPLVYDRGIDALFVEFIGTDAEGNRVWLVPDADELAEFCGRFAESLLLHANSLGSQATATLRDWKWLGGGDEGTLEQDEGGSSELTDASSPSSNGHAAAVH